jgi:hypothetical protein
MPEIIPVTAENFVRAESDMYMKTIALKEGGFGKFEHHRELSPVDAQTVVRQNRDTAAPIPSTTSPPRRTPTEG